MAPSTPLKASFIVLVILAFLITLVSLFTPSWRKQNNGASEQSIGLVTYDCGNNYGQTMQMVCQQSWGSKRGYEKTALGFMILAAILEVITIIAAIATMKSTSRTFIIAPILAIFAAISLVVAFAVYAAKLNDNYNNNGQYGGIPGQPYVPAVPQPGNPNSQYSMQGDFSLGYSYWLAVVAFIFMLVSIFVGCTAAALSGSSGYQTRA